MRAPVTEEGLRAMQEGIEWQDQLDSKIRAALEANQAAARSSRKALVAVLLFIILFGGAAFFFYWYSQPR